MDRGEERRCADLSPFELKNRLVELATHRGERLMLNAGRGNPDWIALEPRAAFVRLGEFALSECERVALGPGFGGLPKRLGVAGRLRGFLDRHRGGAGDALLLRGIEHASAHLDIGMPTETKKSTAKASRMGSDCSAARWLNSLSRSTSPAKNLHDRTR